MELLSTAQENAEAVACYHYHYCHSGI